MRNMKQSTAWTLGVIAACLGVAFAISLFVTNGKTPAPATQSGAFPGKVRAGHLVALDMAPLFVAKEAGFFNDEGIELETVFFPNPGDNNAALAGGSIQFSTNPFTLPYLGNASGQPMRIVSSAGGLGVMQVVIQGKRGIDSMKSLAEWVKKNPGKKLRVGTLKGDTLDVILYRSFQGVGLTYDDFEMVWFNDLLAMVQTFQTNQIDILSHIKPYTTDLEVNHGAKVLTDNSEVWGVGTPNCTVAVMEDFAKKYPHTVKGYLRALRRGYQLIVDEPERAVALIERGKYFQVGKDVLLSAFKNQPRQVVLRPNVEGMKIAIGDLVKLGYLSAPTAKVIDLTFLDAIEAESTKTSNAAPKSTP